MLRHYRELRDSFLTYLLTTKRYSLHTIVNYRRDIDQFLMWLAPFTFQDISLNPD